MDKITELAKLLGEENEKRLKDSITNLIIDNIEDELRDYDKYLIDWDRLLYDVGQEVEQRIKDRIFNIYMDKAEAKIEKVLAENFGD